MSSVGCVVFCKMFYVYGRNENRCVVHIGIVILSSFYLNLQVICLLSSLNFLFNCMYFPNYMQFNKFAAAHYIEDLKIHVFLLKTLCCTQNCTYYLEIRRSRGLSTYILPQRSHNSN